MRYGISALMAVIMLFAGIALIGAGHGWVSGGFGCIALTPAACFAWLNALSRRPSLHGAIATLAFGFVVCLVVAIATKYEGFHYFSGYWRSSGLGGILVAVFAYANWLLMSVVAIVRAQRALRQGI